MSTLIKIRNLYKGYKDKQVLRGINLEIEQGETLVILGRSGTGKSILLRQLMGLEEPDAGEILFNGVSLHKQSTQERYRLLQEKEQRMGMLFQAGALFDSLNIFDNTAFYLREHEELTDEEIRNRVLDALRIVGLEGTEQLMPSDLSGGMRKRAALARLIVYHPKVLLYDEPTTGLDPITSMQINELIVHIQRTLEATSLVVTHDLCSAFYVADRIAFIHEGKILHVTPKDAFPQIEDPVVSSFLKNALPSEIPSRGQARGQ